MNKNLSEIQKAFKGRLVGTKIMQRHVASVLSSMDEKIIKYISTNCWFVSSMEDAWAFVLKGNELKDKYLIFIGEDLLKQSTEQIHYTIAHEIGHVVLRHRNSVFVNQTRSEIRKQEKAAHAFALKYVRKPIRITA